MFRGSGWRCSPGSDVEKFKFDLTEDVLVLQLLCRSRLAERAALVARSQIFFCLVMLEQNTSFSRNKTHQNFLKVLDPLFDLMKEPVFIEIIKLTLRGEPGSESVYPET